MKLVNIFVNGLKIPFPKKSSVKNIIEKFFNIESEFLVCVNSKSLPRNNFDSFFIKENDQLQIVSYSQQCYKPHKRTIFRKDNGE